MMAIKCNLVGNLYSNARQTCRVTGTSTIPKSERCNRCACHYKCQLMILWRINRDIMIIVCIYLLYIQRIPFELDFRVTQVLTDSSGISRYGNSGSILKNRKIGALTNKSESAVGWAKVEKNYIKRVSWENGAKLTQIVQTSWPSWCTRSNR